MQFNISGIYDIYFRRIFLLKVANICNRKQEPDPSKYHSFSKMHADLFQLFKTRKITFFYFFVQVLNDVGITVPGIAFIHAL